MTYVRHTVVSVGPGEKRNALSPDWPIGFLQINPRSSRSARADPNASHPLSHALLPSMPLTSVVQLCDPFLLGWGVGRVLRS